MSDDLLGLSREDLIEAAVETLERRRDALKAQLAEIDRQLRTPAAAAAILRRATGKTPVLERNPPRNAQKRPKRSENAQLQLPQRKPRAKRGVISAEGRAKIAAAQRKRWDRQKGAGNPVPEPAADAPLAETA